MSEPSEDALAMARELYAQFEHADNGNDERALAAAFQRLMDHIDKVEALADKQNVALKEALERWEQARRRYDAAGAVVLGFKERAEKVEADRDEADRCLRIATQASANHHASLLKAEARLAELVRAVRAWWYDAPPCGKQLMRILDEYEGGEHG